MNETAIGFVAIVCLSIGLLAPAPSPEPDRQPVQWMGKLVYAEKDPTGAYAGYTLSIESKYDIGLRADGTVVWRERK